MRFDLKKLAAATAGLTAILVAASVVPAAPVQAGNGAPSGAHYSLNIIGVPKDKTADMTNNSGHRIFVPLWTNNPARIMLVEGDTFAVLDANGTDGSASFQLPNPDPDNSGTTRYSVFARAVGKPGGKANMTTCATYDDPELGLVEICSLAVLEVERSKGKPTFENVSKELLYIYADIDGDGDIDRVPLFDDRMQDYLWSYDNQGLKVLQLRFYECATTVPDPENWQDPVTSACVVR